MYQKMSAKTFLIRYVVAPLLLLRVPQTVVYLIRDRFLNPLKYSSDQKTKRELLGFVVFWAFLLGAIALTHQWYNFLIFWVVPYLTTFQIVNWFCELGEHYPKPILSNLDIDKTRNRFGAWWENFLFGMHNENLHLEHHLNQKIPFWNLPKAREIRLQDPTYRAIDVQTGGLFTRRNNAPSAIEEMLKYHRRR
jgi:fatty acid desaturase